MKRCPKCGRLIDTLSPHCKYCDHTVNREKPKSFDLKGDSEHTQPPAPNFFNSDLKNKLSELTESTKSKIGKIAESGKEHLDNIKDTYNTNKDCQEEVTFSDISESFSPTSPETTIGISLQQKFTEKKKINLTEAEEQEIFSTSEDTNEIAINKPQKPYKDTLSKQTSSFPSPPKIPNPTQQLGEDNLRHIYFNQGIYPPPKKSKTGLIVGIIIGIMVISALILITILLEKKEEGPTTAVLNEEDPIEAATSESEIKLEEDQHSLTPDMGRAYTINTEISGYPIRLILNIESDGTVTGKYAYESTLKKYGDEPSNWFTLRGWEYGDKIFLESYHPNYGVFESWEMTLWENSENPKISGTLTNNNTGAIFFLGSSKPGFQPTDYYDIETNEDLEDYGEDLDY